MDAEEIELVGGEVDALVNDLDAERGRHVAGLEAEPALARLFAARGRAAHRWMAAELRASGAEELATRVAALRADRAQAEDEERWRAAETAARGSGPDGAAPLVDLELAAIRDPDRTRRLAFAAAAAAALGPAASHREAALETRARSAAEVGLAPDWRIVVEGDAALAASDDAYRDVLEFRARHDLALAPVPQGDLARVDLLHVARLARWDGLFRPGMLALALKLTLEGLGLDPGRVRLDDVERPAKWPGVHVHGARISFRRGGGAGDWQDLADGVGRALAASVVKPHRRDPVFVAALGALLGSLLLEPRWLADRADVERRHAADVIRDLALRRLVGLRASAAALRVATEVTRGLSGAAWRETYVDALTAATGARWEGVRAARDADAAGHAAALAGAGAAEALRGELRERFDEDWWRNPRAPPFLAGLLAAGRLPELGDASPARAARALADRLEGKA
jgi:hypothetical protein